MLVTVAVFPAAVRPGIDAVTVIVLPLANVIGLPAESSNVTAGCVVSADPFTAPAGARSMRIERGKPEVTRTS